MKKKLGFSLLIFFALCFLVVYSKFIRRTKGFSLHKITSQYPLNAHWQTKIPENIEDIFCGPFHYLGSGKECYVFVSDNQKYVIKFFKQKHMTNKHPLKVLSFIPSIHKYVEQRLITHRFLREKMFHSFWIAHHELAQETGLVYLHLCKTKNLKRKGLFYDQFHQPFVLNLDQMEFVIQRKASPVFPKVKQLAENNQREEFIKVLRSIFTLIVQRCQKGVGDRDINCEKNLGFIEDRAIEIDVGEFYYCPNLMQNINLQDELEQATADLKNYLVEINPEWKDILEEEIQTFVHDTIF